jgi:hypothetical protein
MTCGLAMTKPQADDGFVVITNNRASSGFLRGAPEYLCRYNQPPEVEAEYVTPTAVAAMKLFDDAQAAAGLTTFRVRWRAKKPQLVKVRVPPSDRYINFWNLKRGKIPSGPTRELGNGYAKLGHPGIAAQLRVAPPRGAGNLEICIFLDPTGLKVLHAQEIT